MLLRPLLVAFAMHVQDVDLFADKGQRGTDEAADEEEEEQEEEHVDTVSKLELRCILRHRRSVLMPGLLHAG